jgi:predicted N-acetyltransferase YhbS
MQSDLIVRAAATPGDLARLRTIAAAQGAARAVERHLAGPRYHPALTRIAERDGAIAGYALIGHRRLRLGAALLEAGAIERIDMPGDPAGVAALLGDCLGALIENGLPLALIQGDPSTYTPFGFAPYRFSALTQLEPGRVPRHGSLRPVTIDDLEDLAALYEATYQHLPLTELRTAPDWRAWLAAGPTALALEDSRARVAAYAIIGADAEPGALPIAEAAAADAGAARVLCAALAAHAQTQGANSLALALSPAHLVAQAALHLGGAASIRATPEDAKEAALAGIVDLPAMLEALAPEFERRLAGSRYAGWGGNLRIEIETERITLAFAEGYATVIDGSRPADLRLRQVALPALAQLLLGYRTAADLRATGGLACDDTALGLIDALFPVLPC